jgi:hypothetical protein
MSVEWRLRAASDDARRKIKGLIPPAVRSRPNRPARWGVVVTAMAALIVVLIPLLVVQPPSDLESGERLLAVNPLTVRGAPGPDIEFEPTSLGAEARLLDVAEGPGVAETIEASGFSANTPSKITVIGETSDGHLAAHVETSDLSFVWFGTEVEGIARVMENPDSPRVNSLAFDGNLIWGPLGPDVAAVTLQYDDVRVWQRPVAGFVVFKTDMEDGDEFSITALDPHGEVVHIQQEGFRR